MLSTDLTLPVLAPPARDGYVAANTQADTSTAASRLISAHAFEELFIEVFGWDRIRGKRVLRVNGQEFEVIALAHKRGFQVFRCVTDGHTLIDRFRLRAIQKQLSAFAHEHILVYSSESPRRQVWQWGLRVPDGSKIRHLEHPFLSAAPPPGFQSRLQQLQIALADEDAVTLVDVIDRVRAVLGAQPELDLFAKRPEYARQSDTLARAMQTGGMAEFRAFVLFHQRLIHWFAQRWHRRFHIDADEAEQLCALGVMRAAQLFDRSRGLQFATYAGLATKRTCRRLAAEIRFPIHLPQYVLPFCFETQRLLERETIAVGPHAARHTVDQHLIGQRKPLRQAWRAFRLQLERHSLSDHRDASYRAARQLAASVEQPGTPLLRCEVMLTLQKRIEQLDDRERTIVRQYYGFDGESHTLQEIGDLLGLTRERIRQILDKIHTKLRRQLDIGPELLCEVL